NSNKHFSEKIATNLKFLNNLQPEWSRHVTIVHQTKDLHTADYTQLCDFLKYNQKENRLIGVPGNVNLNGNGNLVVTRVEGNAAGHNANLNEIEEVNANCILMANPQQASTSGTQTDKAPVYDSDGSAEKEVDELKAERIAKIQDPLALMANSNNQQIAQPGMNMGHDRQIQMIGGNGGNQFRQYAGNLNGYNVVQNVRNQVVQNPRVLNDENQNQIGNEEYDLMAATADLDEIEEVNANCILMANLQQASSSGTLTDSALVYDSDGSAEVHENYDNNEIFNMFTQE
nr:Gag-Pol polyprotein [Tanacetum cinerariifolium]